MSEKNIVLIPGDGIGTEIIAAAKAVCDVAFEKAGVKVNWIAKGLAGKNSFYSYSCFRFGFIGNQPFSTRSRCSNISLIVQKEEKEKTPNKEEIRMSLISTVPIMPAMPSTKNIHQHRVPQ